MPKLHVFVTRFLCATMLPLKIILLITYAQTIMITFTREGELFKHTPPPPATRVKLCANLPCYTCYTYRASDVIVTDLLMIYLPAL